MFIALYIPAWPTGIGAHELPLRLLQIAPRVTLSPGEHLAWLDARGLDAAALAIRALATLRELDIPVASAGASQVPAVASIAARHAAQPIHVVSPGSERRFMASMPIAVLDPHDRIANLLASVGIETCRDLARLERESVEVRFGREGLACWRWARADDSRLIFRAQPRTLPTASIDWTEFATADVEQLVFVMHALLGTVCDALITDGLGARSITLTFALEGGRSVIQQVGSARPTSERKLWLRLVRRALERITLPDRVAGIALQVDGTGPPPIRQGDLFDLGFASAQAADAAVSQVVDLQPDAVVQAERRDHHLPEQRVHWTPDPAVDLEEMRRWTVAMGAPSLSLQLLPTAREVDVLTESRRGAATPLRYTDNGTVMQLRNSLGPQCLSGNHWDAPFRREYYQGVRTDGSIVLLFREERRWYLAGTWD